MLDAIIRGTLGDAGTAVLDFYIDNALWINAILLFYAFCLVFAKRAYLKIKQAIKADLVQAYGESIMAKREKNFVKAVERHRFNWNMLAKETPIPFISPDNSLLFWFKSPNSLKKHFTAERMFQIFHQAEHPSDHRG
jgi:hypothetical protein